MTSEGQNEMEKDQSVLPAQRTLDARETRRDATEVPADARREAECADVVRYVESGHGRSGAAQGRLIASFFIPGEPVAKGRPRAASIGGKARLYTPKKTEKYENLVRLACGDVVSSPVSVACHVRAVAILPVPQSWSKKRAASAIRGDELPTKRPDLDNYLKAILDGMNGVAFHDDSQVVEISARKQYGVRPGVWVSLFGLGCVQ